MKIFSSLIVSIHLLCFNLLAQNQAPIVTINQVTIDEGAQNITVTYNLVDQENDLCTVYFTVSADGGNSFSVNTANAEGDLGVAIAPGNDKLITWNYGSLTNLAELRLRVVADDEQVPDLQTIVNMVDSISLKNKLEGIVGVRHFASNPAGLTKLRDTLQNNFIRNNLEAEIQNFNWQSGNNTVAAENIHAVKKGLTAEPLTYILDAHYDGVPLSPAADDNGSGIAAMLEIMHILKAYQFKKSLRYIGFDLEESGLIGSNRYVQNGIKPYEQIQGVINFEMIGFYSNEPNTQIIPNGFDFLFPRAVQQIDADERRGNFISVVGNQNSSALANAFSSASLNYVPALKTIELIVPGNGQIAPDLRRSDHASFWDAGIQALMITDGANFRNPNYHTANDTLGSLNFEFMQNVTKGALATLLNLLEIMHAGYDTYDVSEIAHAQHIHDFPCNVALFPNPAKHKLSLKISNCAKEEIRLKIFDVGGKKQKEQVLKLNESTQIYEIEIADLVAGKYLILLQNHESVHYVQFIKE